MAIAYRSHSTANVDAGTLLQLTKPTGLANGDLLLLFVHTRTRELGFHTPDGFTQIGETRAREPQGETAAYYKFIWNAASEPASYTLTPKEKSEKSGVAVAYSGVDWRRPIIDSDFWYNDCKYSNYARARDVRIFPDARSVTFATDYSEIQSWTTPSGFTERLDTQGMALSDKGYTHGCYSGSYRYKATGNCQATWVQSCHVSLRAGASAPTAPQLISPIDGAALNRTQPQRFSWKFNDPDAYDTQAGYDLRYKLTSVTSWTTVSGTLPNQFHDFNAGTFSGSGEYEWQCRTYDQGFLLGPWSASATFNTSDPPDAPVITDPTTDEDVGPFFNVTWTATEQESYQLRTVGNLAGSPDESTVYTDTGEVVDSTLRQHEATFDTDGRVEHVQVRVKYQGLWSAWASVRVDVVYVKPPTPTYILTVLTELGAIDIYVTNPPPSGGQPEVLHNEIWVDDGYGKGLVLRAKHIPEDGSWRYWTAVGGRGYSRASVRVRAIADNGTSVWSAES